MQEQDTINILIFQLLSKDDELFRLRKDNELLRSEQQEGNRQILDKLDTTLAELKSMRKDNKNLANQLSKVLEDKAQADHRSELLSSALEELKNLRTAKSFSLRKGTGRDLKKDKDDFDGSNPPAVSCDKSSAALLFDMNIDTSSHSVYKPADPDDTLSPFENVLPGYHVDWDMISQILVDKYQYSMSLERVVDRFKDVNAEFSSSTVLNWVHRHNRELEKLDAPLRSILLSRGSFLFCDETTELVKVLNKSTGKFEYRKKYIWGIKKPALKVAYYLYDQGSRGMEVAAKFFRNFFGIITTDGYNVCKLFDRHRTGVTRYGCMVHVRRKFVETLQTDSRSVKVVQLISEPYGVESDCRIHFLSDAERALERKQRSIPILSELWQLLKPIFDNTQNFAANLFIKAIRYAVNEWEAVCRYVNDGRAEIDNNTAERLMKTVCLGRKNYLFCGSEQAAKKHVLDLLDYRKL